MTTEMITLKLDSEFLKKIDAAVREKSYQNRTEFIRASLHEKIDAENEKEVSVRLEAALKEIRKGIKHHVSDKEYERVRSEIHKNTDYSKRKNAMKDIPGEFIKEGPRA